MSQLKKFWNDFLNNSETAQKSHNFNRFVWQGIPEGDTRTKVWLLMSKNLENKINNNDNNSTDDYDFDSNELDDDVKQSLIDNINSEVENSRVMGLCTGLSDAEILIISEILLNHPTVKDGKYLQGTAQLIATIWNVTNDKHATNILFKHLYSLMKSYYKNDNEKMNNESLVLANVLVKEIPTLCNHFNKCKFDVVDLSHIVSAWCLTFFASYFPSFCVERVIDILLFENVDCLCGIVYGLLKTFHPAILQMNAEDVFSFITNIPPTLMMVQVNHIFKIGYDVYRIGQRKIDAIRKYMNWSKCIASPGTLTFIQNVGDPTKERSNNRIDSKLSNVLKQKKMDSKQRATDERKDMNDNPDDLPDVIFRLEKLRRSSVDPTIAKLLEDASTVLRKQHENLQSNDKNQNDDDASSAESSGEDSDDDNNKQIAFPKGTVPHSKLFQYQQFPCLYMEGYLLKAQVKKFVPGQKTVYGSVHRRFFVLQGRFLTYFKSHRNSKPSRDISVDMRGRKIKRIDKHPFGKYGFQISDVDGKTVMYLMFASQADERNVWVQVLHAAAES